MEIEKSNHLWHFKTRQDQAMFQNSKPEYFFFFFEAFSNWSFLNELDSFPYMSKLAEVHSECLGYKSKTSGFDELRDPRNNYFTQSKTTKWEAE